jgi:crotonobetainyl-CoA:carnitine CoA-transferase CaiB-like acyl-CoA transferase
MGLLAVAFFTSRSAFCARLRFKASIRLIGFSPGVLQRLGLGYDGMKAIRPDFIYTDIRRACGSQIYQGDS